MWRPAVHFMNFKCDMVEKNGHLKVATPVRRTNMLQDSLAFLTAVQHRHCCVLCCV